MRVKEAAEALGITPRAVEYHISLGHLGEVERINDRLFLLKEDEVKRFAAEREAVGYRKPGPRRTPPAQDTP